MFGENLTRLNNKRNNKYDCNKRERVKEKKKKKKYTRSDHEDLDIRNESSTPHPQHSSNWFFGISIFLTPEIVSFLSIDSRRAPGPSGPNCALLSVKFGFWLWQLRKRDIYPYPAPHFLLRRRTLAWVNRRESILYILFSIDDLSEDFSRLSTLARTWGPEQIKNLKSEFRNTYFLP